MEKGCGGSCGSCGGCSGCGGSLSLTRPELDMLLTLGQIPFLPVARKADSMTPCYLEDSRYSVEDYSIILQNLENKGLIDLDYSRPLKFFDHSAYAGYPVRGTISLTARGQTVLELIEVQGVEE